MAVTISEENEAKYDRWVAAVMEKYDFHDAIDEFFPEIAANAKGHRYPATFGGYVSANGDGLWIAPDGWNATNHSAAATSLSLVKFLAICVWDLDPFDIECVRFALYERTGVNSWDFDIPMFRRASLKESEMQGGYAWDGRGFHSGVKGKERSEASRKKYATGRKSRRAIPVSPQQTDPYASEITMRMISVGEDIPSFDSLDIPPGHQEQAVAFFERLWSPDDIVFIANWTKQSGAELAAKCSGQYYRSGLVSVADFVRKKGLGINAMEQYTTTSRFHTTINRKGFNVKELKYMLFEFDDLSTSVKPPEDMGPMSDEEKYEGQLAFWRGVVSKFPQLRPTTLCTSGGKSIHALIDVRALGMGYEDALKTYEMITWGLGADINVKDKVRVCRMPCGERVDMKEDKSGKITLTNTGRSQDLLYLCPDNDDEIDWAERRRANVELAEGFRKEFERTIKMTENDNDKL